MDEDEFRAIDDFDPELHRPPQEPDENLLVYQARAAHAVFSSAIEFCRNRVRRAHPPRVLFLADRAATLLQRIGCYQDVINVIDEALPLEDLDFDDPVIRSLLRLQKQAAHALAAGKPAPRAPAGVTAATPLADLGTPKAAVTILARIGIRTVGAFTSRTYEDLARRKGIGRATLDAASIRLRSPTSRTSGRRTPEGQSTGATMRL
jgi:hypothetical protein